MSNTIIYKDVIVQDNQLYPGINFYIIGIKCLKIQDLMSYVFFRDGGGVVVVVGVFVDITYVYS